LEQVKLQLSRTPKPLPQIQINSNVSSIFDYQYTDFELLNYQPHPHIKGEIAV
jgi:thymidylate synthase